MITAFRFLSEKELLTLIKLEADSKIIVWGCGITAGPVINTLKELNIEISYYGDSNDSLRGTRKDGLVILGPEDMKDHLNDIVLIASFGYVPIFRMLTDIGIKKVYALRDIYKYPFRDMKEDQLKLKNESTFFHTKDNILIELYGNIGDTIVRIGIVKKILELYGKDQVYLLFADRRNAEIYRLLTDNIVVLEEKDLNDVNKRVEILKYLWNLDFTKSYVLCDAKIYAQRRLLNEYNSNIREVIFSDVLPEQEYLAGIDMETIISYLDLDGKTNLSAWNRLTKDDLAKVSFDKLALTEKYIVINLGASRKIRQYDPDQFIDVCKFMIEQGLKIVTVGYGEDDDKTSECLQRHFPCNILNLTSKLTLQESALVISRSQAFVGTESGMWNLSYTLGKPSVVIYGGGDYGSFKHPDGNVRYVTVSDKSCFGCKWYCNKINANGQAKCVYDITADMIIKELKLLIDDME